MKKAFLIPIVSLFCLAACNSTNTSNPAEGITEYESTSWDNVVDAMIDANTNNSSHLVPRLNGSAYYTFYDKLYSEDKTVSIDCTFVAVYGVNPNKVENDYLELLEKNSYAISSSSPAAYHYINPTDDLIVQYDLYDEQNPAMFLLIFYSQTNREEDISDFVSMVSNDKLPMIEAEAYTASGEYIDVFDVDDPYNVHFGEQAFKAMVYAHNVSKAKINEYYTTLANNEYVITGDDGIFKQYTSKDGYIVLTTYETADEYNRSTLYLSFYSKWWMAIEYSSYYLGVIIPEIAKNYTTNISYGTYTFQDGSKSFLIYDYYASNNDYSSYVLELCKQGWSVTEQDNSKMPYTTYLSIGINVDGQIYRSDICVQYGYAEYISNYAMIVSFSIK